MPSPTIDPRLPQELIDLLDEYEVPHDCDALLWEIEKRGYSVTLSGPDTRTRDTAYRWVIHGGPDSDRNVHEMFIGQTARIALALAFQWIVSREGDDE